MYRNKRKKNNPCNNDNDLITILQTKIKKRSNLNKNKSLIEKIENDIKDLNIKFIEDAQTVKNTQNNELEQKPKNIINIKKEIELLEYQYLELDRKKDIDNNIENLLKRNKTDYIKKIINKNESKLQVLDKEQLLLSDNITEKYDKLNIYNQTQTKINYDSKNNIKLLQNEKKNK